MARNATHVVLGVNRIDGVHVLGAARMAGHATVVDLLGRGFLEGEDLGDVAAARHVGRSGAVAGFTSLVRRTAFGVEGGLPVGGLLPTAIDILVAGLAGLGTDVSV